MKLKLNEKNKKAQITVQNINDLFLLYLLINEKDELYGWTTRQKRIISKDGKIKKTEKKKIFLGIKVKRIYFHSFLNSLKVIGTIIYKPEDLSIDGQHHSFNIQVGDTITLKKEDWSSALTKSILKGLKETYPKSLIISLDYGNISIALLDNKNMKIIYSLTEDFGGKKYNNEREQLIKKFIKKNEEKIKEIINLNKPSIVILYSPSILKEIFFDKIKSLCKKTYKVYGSIGGIEGIYEALRNENVLKFLKNEGIEDFELLHYISKKPNKIAFGIDEVEKASKIKMIEKLLISTKLIKDFNKVSLERVRKIAEEVIKYRGDINVIYEESEIGEMMKRFGNIIAFLRYEIY